MKIIYGIIYKREKKERELKKFQGNKNTVTKIKQKGEEREMRHENKALIEIKGKKRDGEKQSKKKEKD